MCAYLPPFRIVYLCLGLFAFLLSNSQNILSNGDFEAGGITGFDVNGNGYSQLFPPFSGTTNPGNFALVNNPQLMNTNFFISGGDHTTGNGRMLAFDGNTVGGQQRFWRAGDGGTGLCCVQPGTTYRFSYWIKSIATSVTNTATRANIGVQITNANNITLTSGAALAPLPTDGWQQVTYSFVATSSCVNIELWNNNTNPVGNDFAIDDMLLVSLDAPLAATYSLIDLNCPQQNTGFVGIYPTGGVPPYNFTITKPGFVDSNDTGFFEELLPGEYIVEVTDDVGNKISFFVELLVPEPILFVSPDQSFCFGETSVLEAYTDFDVTWTSVPEDESMVDLGNNTLQVSPLESTSYFAEIEYAVDIEVIYNGDFSLGNEGFYSDYNFVDSNPSGAQGVYGVVANASSWFAPFDDCAAQEGTNFLVADGATENNCKDKLWCQSVFIIPGNEYEFSYWIQALNSEDINPANIVVEINGVTIGQDSSPSLGCDWQERNYTWTAGGGTMAEICIYNTEKAANGNDFGIDNIQFSTEQICIETKRINVEIENCFCPEIFNPQGEQIICQNESLAPVGANVILQNFAGAINFVYFDTPQEGNDMYTGGTLLGQVAATSTVNYNFPPLGQANSLPNVPGTYYVYAILSELPPNPNCRPFVEIPITIQEVFTSTFDLIDTICSFDTYILPSVSDNGFEGTWSPSNSVEQSGIYTFSVTTPDCVEDFEIEMTVIPDEQPQFDLPTDICSDGFIEFPSVSNNGYQGTWSPPFNPSEDTTYTFTPLDDQCTNQTFSITIFSQEIIYNEEEITPLEVCDENNNGFSSLFDLNARIDEITLSNPDLSVSFHLTEADANTGVSPVQSPYSNVNAYQQTLYARVFKPSNNCYKITTLDLFVYDAPLMEDIEPIVKCDTLEVGLNFFDLTSIEENLFVPGQDTSDFEISYHLSQNQANSNINAISNTTNYLMQINPQTIFVRVEDPTTPINCTTIQPFQLIVNPLPEITPPSLLAACEEDDTEDNASFETTLFDLSLKIPEITNDNTSLDVFFYESQEDQANDNPILAIENYQNISNPQVIFVSVFSEDDGCVQFTTLTLQVEPTPFIPELDTLFVCDADNEGTSEVDLLGAIDTILDDEENTQITFHLTEVDAINADNPIVVEDENGNSILFQVFNPFGQTLYVRAEFFDSNGDCFVIRPLPLEVRESPLIQELEDLVICDDQSLNGFAPFDLTQNTPLAIGQLLPDNVTVSYHENQEDAALGLNPIAVPSSYTNITNPQTIYVRLTDNETNCYDLFGFEGDNSFTLEVESYPALFPLEIPLEECNTQVNPDANFPTGLFDLTEKIEELTGLSPVPADITIAFYESEEDVLNQENAIENPTEYINSSNPPMTIFLEVINTTTVNQCSNYIPFTINVLPFPFPVDLTEEERRLIACDDDNDGVASEPFDVTQIGQLITGNENNVGSYYLTQDAANEEDPEGLITNPTAYINDPLLNELDENFFPTNTQIVWLRLDSNANGNFCYVTVPIELIVEPNPEINPVGSPFGYTLCEGNPTQLPTVEEVIFSLYDVTNGSPSEIISVLNPANPNQEASDYEFSLHLSETEAEAGINPLASGYQASSGQTLYLRVTHVLTECYNIDNIAEILITIEPRPEITTTDLFPLVVCADEQANAANQEANQGVATIDLTQRDDEIDPNSNEEESNTFVEYFASEDDYWNGIAIEDPTNFITSQTPTTIFAAVVDLNNFCSSLDFQTFDIIVNPLPLVDISNRDGAVICIHPQTGEVIENDFSPPTLDTQLSEELYAFEWFRNDSPIAFSGSAYTPTQAGLYTVVVTDLTNNVTSCQASSSAEIFESNPPSFSVNVISLAFDGNQSIEISNIEGSGNYEFSIDGGEWQSLVAGQTTLVFSDLGPGEHVVRGRDSGGCGELVVPVFLIGYPPFFTPNEDGANDTWNIIGLENQPNAKIYIFDRFGKLMKQLSPTGPGWNGNYNGKPMINNDYWFSVEFEEPSTGQKRIFKSHFTLKR